MHACIHTYARTHVRTHARTYIRTYVHTYIRTYVHTYIHTYMHTCIHAYMHTCIHAYIHAYMHTCIHAYMHTCIHVYMHTYMRIHTICHRYQKSRFITGIHIMKVVAATEIRDIRTTDSYLRHTRHQARQPTCGSPCPKPQTLNPKP